MKEDDVTYEPEPTRAWTSRKPRTRRPARILILAVLAGAGLTLGASTTAFAAEDLVSSYPTADSTMATVPDEITLTFDENLRLDDVVRIEVIAPSGENIATDDVGFSDASATQHLAADAAPGEYLVRWQITSSGAESAEGEYIYTIDPSLSTPEPSPDPTSDAVTSSHPEETPSGYEAGTAPQTDDIFLPFIGIMLPIAIIAPVGGMVLMMRRERKRRDARGSDEA